jgi:DNA-binding NtrC family response regulator
MKNVNKTKTDDWNFLATVTQAAFANPFGEVRDNLDALIAGAEPATPSAKLLGMAISKVAERVAFLRRSGQADLRKCQSSDLEVMRTVLLFHVFHHHLDDFDRLIQHQLKNGDTSCKAGFARDVLQELDGFGFSEVEALRYLAVFYQLRRAYYFIWHGLVGSSPAMRTLRKHLWNCVFTNNIRWYDTHLWQRMEDFSVLLLGETGTGKGAAAAAIGRSGYIPFDQQRSCFSESFMRNFVAINLSQYSEGVLESELFGHRKGAFTGAVENHEGLLSRCAPHGVVFLDEIGDVSTQVQIKLLQVLQDRHYSPVGSHEVRRFSGRVVAATNRSLQELRRDGRFRDDFFYRLCSDVVALPPLRQRLRETPAELDLLLENILIRIAGEAPQRERQLVRKVLDRDLGPDYPWHGNVRELEQAVKRIIITGHYHGDETGVDDSDAASRLATRVKDGELTAEGLLAEYCGLLYRRFGTYEEVARQTRLDRRTVKKYVQMVGE